MKIYGVSHKKLSVQQTGGKGKNLFSLAELGIDVPPFVVIDPVELEHLIAEEHKENNDFEAILQQIDDYHFPGDFQVELGKHFKNHKEKIYAVRSSAVQEDGKKFSFAGQFESHLYVQWEDIPKFVKEVWKSNFSDRVVAYLKSNDITPQFGIGVIVQEMIDPEVSGVAFGINPNTGSKDSKVICSVFGVGEGIVSGELNADTFTLDQGHISSDIVKKDQKGVRAGSGKIAYENVPKDVQESSSLSEKEIKEIAAVLNRLEKALKAPQDIEFAVKDGKVYLLQTRPITSVYPTHEKQKKNRIIWDNSNIVESYPGVTTPLTFSYIREAYEKVYLQLATIMGADKKTLKDNEKVFANMLGLINGRVYYNLLSWYKVLALFPGYSLNARFMENMMGVKERFDLEKKPNSNKFKALYRTGVMVSKIIINLMTIKKQTRKFMALVNKSLDEIKQFPMDQMTAYELKTTWIDLDAHLTPKWEAPLINDSFAMIYFGKLQKLIEKYQISDNPNLQNDLLCGSKDIISVEPVHRSIALATEIGENAQLKELFLNHSEKEIWDRLQKENHPFLQKIKDYIAKFGERCVGELKLETISFNQDPTLFLQTLKSFVKQNVKTSSTDSTIDKDLRDAGEKLVKKALKNRPFRKYKFQRTLNKARYFVSNRENLRYERTRVFGITREIFSAIGKQFEKNNAIEHHRDIFYLTKEEIFDFVEGTSVTKDLKALIEIRKEEYAAFEEMPTPPDRITTYETVNYYNDFYEETESDIDENADLKGIGCCPGIVKAKVRIVKHPNEVESLDGDILVTSSTDPGWVTLFPTCSAIIVERGSLLSHSAIVSREMGIPCIVGVTNLLKQVKTGETIEMDGSKGTIKRIEK